MPTSEALWGKLVAKTWQDAHLREKLLVDPIPVLTAHGIDVPPGMTVKVMENTESILHLSIPARPSSRDLSEERLGAVAGGALKPCCHTVANIEPE